jgi:hypothetical protein
MLLRPVSCPTWIPLTPPTKPASIAASAPPLAADDPRLTPEAIEYRRANGIAERDQYGRLLPGSQLQGKGRKGGPMVRVRRRLAHKGDANRQRQVSFDGIQQSFYFLTSKACRCLHAFCWGGVDFKRMPEQNVDFETIQISNFTGFHSHEQRPAWAVFANVAPLEIAGIRYGDFALLQPMFVHVPQRPVLIRRISSVCVAAHIHRFPKRVVFITQIC